MKRENHDSNYKAELKAKNKKAFATAFWDRLQQFLKKRGDKVHYLTRHLNVSPSYFVHMIYTNGVMGSDVLAEILKLYPELNAEWLLLGTGTMLKNASVEDLVKYEKRMSIHKDLQKNFKDLEKVLEKIKDLEKELGK
jgi:hypothetical protein